MVDTVLGEHNALETEDKQGLKSDRRRVNRRNRTQKENSGTADRKAIRADRNEAPQSRSLNRNPRNKAPRTVDANGDIKEKADYTDGILRLKISNARPRTVYTRLVRLMLAGFDGSGNPLETSKPIEKIEVSALGNAIVSAIFVVDNLIKGKVVEQTSMSGDFITVGEQQSESRSRGTARLLIDLKRVSDWEAKDDDVLRKTRVYRTKVLGLPEDA